jgi:hypothetical protein
MKCRRAFETDLLAVLRGESADADFLAHYPSCADCAAEVRVWSELDGMLRAAAPAEEWHPALEVLLQLVDAPAALATDKRRALEHHLVGCRVCADEVWTLRSFDPASVVIAAPSRVAAAVAPAPSPRAGTAAAAPASAPGAVPERGSWLGRLVWHPAFAYALVAVLLVPLLRGSLPRLTETARLVDARRDQPLLPPASEGDIGTVPPGAFAKRERPGVPAEAKRVAPPAGAPQAAPKIAAAPPPPPAAPAQALAERRAENMVATTAPAADERSADAEMAAAPALARAAKSRQASSAGLTDRLRHATVPAGVPPAALAAGGTPVVLEIQPRRPALFAFRDTPHGALLRVTPPADLAPGPLDVVVRSRAGAREIRVRVTDRANAIALQIPPAWLLPGDYVVTLQSVAAGADGTVGAPAMLGFSVSAPTTP